MTVDTFREHATRSSKIKNLSFQRKKHKRPFRHNVGRVGASGQGERGDYSCDLHREFTVFPPLCVAVPEAAETGAIGNRGEPAGQTSHNRVRCRLPLHVGWLVHATFR
jgi:hypothetical protein